METETAAPGEKPRFLGVRENRWNLEMTKYLARVSRVTHVVIFILVGLSAFMSPILAKIPMPVLLLSSSSLYKRLAYWPWGKFRWGPNLNYTKLLNIVTSNNGRFCTGSSSTWASTHLTAFRCEKRIGNFTACLKCVSLPGLTECCCLPCRRNTNQISPFFGRSPHQG